MNIDETNDSVYTEDSVEETAVQEPNPTEGTQDSVNSDESDPKDTEDLTDTPTGEGEEDTQKDDPKSNIPDDTNPLWQKRVERARRSVEKEFMSEATSMSEGVGIERKEIPQAVRLWNFLKANPTMSDELQGLIDTKLTKGEIRELKAHASNPLNNSTTGNVTEDRYELQEHKFDLKLSDPVYRKYESKINEWAEENEFTINSKKTLSIAYKAWKGEQSTKLIADAEETGKKKASDTKAKNKEAKLSGKVASPVKGKSIDYSKATDREILQAEGLKLIIDD